MEFLKSKSEKIAEIDKWWDIIKEQGIDKLPLEDIKEIKKDVEAALDDEVAQLESEPFSTNTEQPEIESDSKTETETTEDTDLEEEIEKPTEPKAEDSEAEAESPEEKSKESSSESKGENIEDTKEADEKVAKEEKALGFNEAEQMKKYEHFTRKEIAELIESGASNEEIWETVKNEGVFFKFDGSSYYLSSGKKEDKIDRENHSEEEQGKYTWRGRSATNHTHSNYEERVISGFIEKALEDYRELKKAYPSLKDAIMAADMVQENEQKYTTKQIMNKVMPMSEYWDEISKTIPGYEAEKKTESSVAENETSVEVEPGDIVRYLDEEGDKAEEAVRVTDTKREDGKTLISFDGGKSFYPYAETVEEGRLNKVEPASDEAEQAQDIDESADGGHEEKESAEELSEGDKVYYMEKEMRRWRDPKKIIDIKNVDGDQYAKFEGEDSLFPLSKLKPADDAAASETEYRPGPKDAGEYLADEDVEGVPDASEIVEEIPEELKDVPGASEVAEEVEGMSEKEREKVDQFWQNLGYKAEQAKAWVQKKTWSKLSDTLNKSNDQSSMARWVTALKDQATEKEQQAQEARVKREETKKDGTGWERTKSFLGDKWQITANALKAGSMFISPHRWFMLGGLAVSSGAEAGKEARFNNIDFIKETRYEDAEAAAAEAWAVYEQAEKQAGGDNEVTKEILQDAYTQSLPENILRRLGEYEEFERDTMDDVDEAHAEALRIQREAQRMSDTENVSTENLQKAFEKLFADPRPGQNTNFIGSLFQKQITRLAKRAQNKFLDIDMDDSLTDAQKKAKKEQFLSKWGRSKALQDYDRMITEQGKIDSWAMSAHEAQRVGKGVVAATMAHTFYKTLSLLPDLFTSTHDITEEIDPSDPSIGGDEGDATGETQIPESRGGGESDAAEGGQDIESRGGEGDVELDPVSPEAGAETLGVQEVAIDDKGEGMIHAIADMLEDEFEIPREQAMRIGNELYLKGEQLEGTDAEMFNLVGEGSSFSLDFGDLTAEALESQPAEDLVQDITFSQEAFEEGPSRIKGLELPEQESSASAGTDNATGNNTGAGSEWSGEGRSIDTKSVDAASFSGDESPTPPTADRLDTGLDQLRETIAESNTVDQIQDELDKGINQARMNANSTYEGIRVSALSDLRDHLRDHSHQNLVDIVDGMKESNPKLLVTLDQVIELENPPAGSSLDQLDRYISTGVSNVTVEAAEVPTNEAVSGSGGEPLPEVEVASGSSLELLANKSAQAEGILHGSIDTFLAADGEPPYLDRIVLPENLSAEKFMTHLTRLNHHPDLLHNLDDLRTDSPEQFQALRALYEGYFQYSTDPSVEEVTLSDNLRDVYGALHEYINSNELSDLSAPTELEAASPDTDPVMVPDSADGEATAADAATWDKNLDEAGIIKTTSGEAINPAPESGSDLEQVREEFGQESITIDAPEAINNVSGSAADVEVLTAEVDAIEVDKLRQLAAEMEAQSVVESGYINVPTDQLEALEIFLADNSTHDPSEIIQKMSESNPELLTAFEQVMSHDDIGDIEDRKSLSPLRRYTQQLVSQLTEEDFPNGMPDYARTSIEESKLNLQK